MSAPLLDVQGASRTYALPGKGFGRGGSLRAVHDVSFQMAPGEILGLVGESGSGKSTLGRLILHLEDLSSGKVFFDGQRIDNLRAGGLKPIRRQMQVVFQDPYSALNPRMRVGAFVAEPFIVHGLERQGSALEDRVAGLFRKVGLDPAFMRRYPHEFSGGQRQRINIARAIALSPKLIVADEAITALDVSIQAQILNLFQDLKDEFGLAYLFIAHDLSVVRYLCQRVAVMQRGRIVEMGATDAIFGDARHGYTRSLLSAIPIPDPARERARRLVSWSPGPQDAAEQLGEVAPGHWVMS